MADTASSVWTRILALAASTLAFVVVAAAGYVVNGIDNDIANCAEADIALDAKVDGMAIRIAESIKHAEDHDRESAYWKTRIGENSDGIGGLQQNVMARPDSFTGTQGDAMERRIDALERGMVAVASLTDRVGLVEKDQREYQAAMLLLFQQSNSLQMQQIHQGME